MDPRVGLLLEDEALRAAERPLLVDPPIAEALRLREAFPRAVAFSTDARASAAFAAWGGDHREGAFYSSEGEHDLAIVFAPKGTQRREMMTALAAFATSEDGRVAVVGHRKAGIKAAVKALRATAGDEVLVAHGGHCQLAVGRRPPVPAERGTLHGWAERFEVRARGVAFRAVSFPGVFSAGRLDDGTRLLLEHLHVPSAARVLDVGCGAGVIGVAAALHAPTATVTMLDVDHVAVEAARRTCRENALSLEVRASDAYAAARGPYDLVLVNPPFHQGVTTEYDVAHRMLTEAPLAPTGSLVAVANRHLPYAPLLESSFHEVRVLAEDRRFRVFEARAPRA